MSCTKFQVIFLTFDFFHRFLAKKLGSLTVESLKITLQAL